LTQRRLLLVLQEREGLLARQARVVLQAIFSNIKKHLQERGRAVTKLGLFELVDGPLQRERERWGKKQTLFRNPKKVVFRPSAELRRALNRPVSNTEFRSEPLTAPGNVHRSRLCCDRCGAAHFNNATFRHYRKIGSLLSHVDGS
jgi:nucleoid DNA-binding protein